MSKKNERPIVVVEGAPEWMVTFGDLMSLLLTFFILLFSISEVKSQKIYELIKSFKVHWNIAAPTMGYHVEQLSDVVNMLSEFAIELPDQKEGTDGKTRVKVKHPFGENASVIQIENNLKINISGKVLFDENKAQLKDEARDILQKIKERLRGHNNRIRTIGHASPTPLPPNSTYRDHNELGYERARAVTEFLTSGTEEDPGIRAARFTISSRGDTELLSGVTDLHDYEQRRLLDRVEIMVTPESAFRTLK